MYFAGNTLKTNNGSISKITKESILQDLQSSTGSKKGIKNDIKTELL